MLRSVRQEHGNSDDVSGWWAQDDKWTPLFLFCVMKIPWIDHAIVSNKRPNVIRSDSSRQQLETNVEYNLIDGHFKPA